jgi:hypothetical protein
LKESKNTDIFIAESEMTAVRLLFFLFSFSSLLSLSAQTIYTIKSHYESLNISPYTYFQLHDTVALEFSHKLGTMDLYAVKYTYPGTFTATPIVVDKNIAGDYRVVLPIEESGCYQFRVVPGPKLRYVHGELAVKTGPKMTCTIDLDTGYMAKGKEFFFDQEQLASMEVVKTFASASKQVHSNGTMYGEVKFRAAGGEKIKVELKTDPSNSRLNLLVKRDEEPYETIVYRTYQNEDVIGFEVTRSGIYLVQYWGRDVFDRLDEVSVSKVR